MAKIIHEQFLCQLLLQLSLKPNILSLLYWHMLALDQIWKWKLFALCSLSRVHLLNWIPILVQRMFVDLKYYFGNLQFFHFNNFSARILPPSLLRITPSLLWMSPSLLQIAPSWLQISVPKNLFMFHQSVMFRFFVRLTQMQLINMAQEQTESLIRCFQLNPCRQAKVY